MSNQETDVPIEPTDEATDHCVDGPAYLDNPAEGEEKEVATGSEPSMQIPGANVEHSLEDIDPAADAPVPFARVFEYENDDVLGHICLLLKPSGNQAGSLPCFFAAGHFEYKNPVDERFRSCYGEQYLHPTDPETGGMLEAASEQATLSSWAQARVHLASIQKGDEYLSMIASAIISGHQNLVAQVIAEEAANEEG